MTYETIDISEDVFKKLIKMKHENETFSDVIRRLISKNEKLNSIEEFAGIFEEDSEEWENIEKKIYEDRLKSKSSSDIEF